MKSMQFITLNLYLIKSFYSVTEVAEGYEYQVHFRAGCKDFSLTVTLKGDFPNDKPTLKISPVVIHPWVSSDGEITGAPGLLNVCYCICLFSSAVLITVFQFTVHSDLGRVVQAIVREFQRTPPPLFDQRTNSITSPTVPITGIMSCRSFVVQDIVTVHAKIAI